MCLQMHGNLLNLQLGLLSTLCILVSVICCSILYSFYSTVPVIKKNILTCLDELLVFSFTFFVCFQCSLCLLSLLTEKRNESVYFVFYIILYGDLVNIMGIGIGLSFSRVFIILRVCFLKFFNCTNIMLVWKDILRIICKTGIKCPYQKHTV